MNRRTRLIFLLLSLIALFAVGFYLTGSFQFATTQFWFTSGLLLLILLSLIDQPNFSKDSNVFINATTAWMSLMLVTIDNRDWVWWTFFGIVTYLIASSYVLIWVRQKELKAEHWIVAFITRVNREIGKPQVIFSTFFLWGAIRQFSISSFEFDALLLYWIVFTILNLPAFATALNRIFEKKATTETEQEGVIRKLVEPNVAEVSLPLEFPDDLIGRIVDINSPKHTKVGEGVILEERVVSGLRIGKLAITSTTPAWKEIADSSGTKSTIALVEPVAGAPVHNPVSIVDKGTTIGDLVFFIHPSIKLEEGEITYVENEDGQKVFFQVVSAVIIEEPTSDGNAIQSVKVIASQLGLWDPTDKTFTPYTWVPASGRLVYRGKDFDVGDNPLPGEYVVVGCVPNSNFPVHTCLEDIVTHNAAIIGVTGCGKSYLAFHLIEALLGKGVKVMVLDLTREHFLYLNSQNPYPLAQVSDVTAWLTGNDPRKLAVHQFATATSFPRATSDFVKAAFDVISQTQLQVGKNLPATLCIVFEEAHSLIPEWNQVSIPSDKDDVNKTARLILQGRKYGLGSIVVTQRTANVTKTILNQCNTIIALQSFDQTGLEFLRNYMGDDYSGSLSRLPQRQGVLVGKASSSQRPIIFKIEDFENRWKGEAPATDNPQDNEANVAVEEAAVEPAKAAEE